jgi:flagellar export protein FliJ
VKRAAFRLQPVLELRRLQEKAAALAAAQAARAAAEAEHQAAERERSLTSARVPASGSSPAFVAALAILRSAADDAAEARAMAVASAEQAEVVRAGWTAAAQRTKGLERLRDRHADAVLSAERTAEEKAVDDLVTGRARPGREQREVPWTD